MKCGTKPKAYNGASDEYAKGKKIKSICSRVSGRDQFVRIERICKEYHGSNEVRVYVAGLVVQVKEAPERFSIGSSAATIPTTKVLIVALPEFDLVESE